MKIFKSPEKAFSALLAVVLTMCAVLAVNTLNIGASEYSSNVTVIVNGQEVKSGLIVDSRTYVPLRSVCEALTLEVEWNAEEQSIFIYDEYYTITVSMFIDSCSIIRQKESNDWEVEFLENDLPPRIINETTYVPLRAISILFEAYIYWDNDNKTADIFYPGSYSTDTSTSDDSYYDSVTSDAVGYWISQNDTEAIVFSGPSSRKMYLLQIDSIENNRVSGVLIRNSTHFRDYGFKYTFMNAPLNDDNSFTLSITDFYTFPLSDDNSTSETPIYSNYVVTLQGDTIYVENAEGSFGSDTLVKCSQSDFNSAYVDQKNESFGNYYE